MAVSTTLRALRARIDHKLHRWFLRCEKIEARFLQGRRFYNNRALMQFIPLPHAISPQQPDRLFTQSIGKKLVVTSLKQNCTCGQWIQHMLAAIPPRIEDTPAVVIAETRRRTTTTQQVKSGQHFFQSGFKAFRNRDAVQSCQYVRVQKQIERVDVVIRRLLEMKSVGADLTAALSQHDLPAQ